MTIDGAKAALELDSDGVLHLTWMPNVSVEAADARAAMGKVNDLCRELARPLLVDLYAMAYVSPGARTVFSTSCAASRIALLGSGPVDWVIGTFAFSIGARTDTVRFFTSLSEATNWLLENAAP